MDKNGGRKARQEYIVERILAIRTQKNRRKEGQGEEREWEASRDKRRSKIEGIYANLGMTVSHVTCPHCQQKNSSF